MTDISDQVEYEELFTLSVTEGGISSQEGYRFETLDGNYILLLSPSNMWRVKEDFDKFRRIVAAGYLEAIGTCFTEETNTGLIQQDGVNASGLLGILGEDKILLAFADLNNLDRIRIASLPGLREFIMFSTPWAFDNAMPLLHEKTVVRSSGNQRSAAALLSGEIEFIGVRPTEYDSLASYLANNGGQIKIGDLIRNVEMTTRVKGKEYGAFTVGNIPVRVPGSTPQDIYDVRVTEQITGTMFRAEVVSS